MSSSLVHAQGEFGPYVITLQEVDLYGDELVTRGPSSDVDSLDRLVEIPAEHLEEFEALIRCVRGRRPKWSFQTLSRNGTRPLRGIQRVLRRLARHTDDTPGKEA